jgi:DNA-binding CsgD family transcriptional regulator
MAPPTQQIVGREPELEQIGRFIDAIPNGPSSLLIEGEAGIGKTTLWLAGVDRGIERGFIVVVTRCGQSETKLSLTGLGDLLGPLLDEALPKISPPLAASLEIAFLRVESHGSTPDRRAICLAALEVLRVATASKPLVLAVDDLQWLDPSSARVLEFCARRIRNEALGILASVRVGNTDTDSPALAPAMPDGRLHRLAVGAMPLNELSRVIRTRSEADLPYPVVRRVHAAAAGNPFFALEIAREVLREGGPPVGEVLPVPSDLTDLLRRRVAGLPRATRDALLVAASTSRPTPQVVRSASGLDDRTDAALARAESAGVLHTGGETIRFAHPLLASTVYASATTQERRSVHRRLAEHVEDPEERARHLALSSVSPDARIASELDEAAAHARSRGALDSAAELLEFARRLTPLGNVVDLRQRTVQAAQHYFDSGDAAKAWALFEEAIAAAPSGIERAQVLFSLAAISWMDMRRVGELCEQARREAEDDAELLAAIHEHLAWVGIYRGNLADASHHAVRSMELTEGIADPEVRAATMSTFGMVEFLAGRPPQDLMVEADRLQDLGTTEAAPGIEASTYTASRVNHGLQLLWAGDPTAARTILQQELSGYERRGRYLFRDEILCYLAELECRAGNLDAAARAAEEAFDIDVESGRLSGVAHMQFPRALVAAHRGDVGRARSDAEEGLRESLRYEDLLDANCHRSVLGFLELSLGNPAGAHGWLEPVVRFLADAGIAEPGVIPCLPDEIEALILLGDTDAAETLLTILERQSRSLDRPWALATAARCRGLLFAARKDLDAACEALERALKEHDRVGQPLELGRTLLVTGEVERRAKRKRAARVPLEDALRIFEKIGAQLWAERATRALERVGGFTGTAGELTPTERRVAELVADGKTNREVARLLFVSVKTVEANLSRIFHKLGVRSRAELIRHFADQDSDAHARE